MRSRWRCPCYLAACALIRQPESEKDTAGPKCVVMTLWKSQQSVSVLLLEWLQCCNHVTGLMWVMEGSLNSAQQGQTHRGLHTHPERGRSPLCRAAAPSAGSFRATTLPRAPLRVLVCIHECLYSHYHRRYYCHSLELIRRFCFVSNQRFKV